jgi:hypothetical protein
MAEIQVPLFGVGDEEKRRLSEDNRRFEFYGGHRPPLQIKMGFAKVSFCDQVQLDEQAGEV